MTARTETARGAFQSRNQISGEYWDCIAPTVRDNLRALAINVLYQAYLDAHREGAPKAINYLGPVIQPRPSAWIETDECRVWCDAADVSHADYCNAIKFVLIGRAAPLRRRNAS